MRVNVRTGVVAGVCVAAAMAGVRMLAQGGAAMPPVNQAPNPYQTIENHFKLPEGRAWGSTSAVDIDKDGKIELEELYAWPLAFKIAGAMKAASVKLNVPIVWGGVWDRGLSEIKDPEQAVADYVLRRRKQNKAANIDGPHFELARSKYP